MTNREITSLALKVFAIYVLVKATLQIPWTIQSLSNYQHGDQSAWLWVLGALAIVLLLIGFAIFSWKLANNVIKNVIQPTTEADKFKVDQPFILSLFGIYLSIKGLQLLLFEVTRIYFVIKETDQEVSANLITHIIAYLTQTVIGLSLILRSNGWTALLHKVRSFGLKEK